MIAHEAEGEDSDAAETGVLAHQEGEVLFFEVAEDELPVNDPGHAVVEAAVGIGRGLEASSSHGSFPHDSSPQDHPFRKRACP